MLPKQVPQLPQLEIAAYMKTASEVGGDYYDFHLVEDGTLTVAVGDATGHGLKAGTLVSSVKSLFISLTDHPDIPHILHRMSGAQRDEATRVIYSHDNSQSERPSVVGEHYRYAAGIGLPRSER